MKLYENYTKRNNGGLKMEELNIIFSTEYFQLRKVQKQIQNYLRENLYNSFEAFIGINEILINSFEHANQFDPAKNLKVKIHITERKLIVKIEDEGEGFCWGEKISKDFSVEEILRVNKNQERGRGLMIASEVFDLIKFNRKGNKVFLHKMIVSHK